jgi:hypothetical protein
MTYRYPTIKVNGKTKLKHRHLAEQRLGRALSTDEHVHHENRDRFDTSDGNLIVKPGLEHIREHAEERRIHPRSKACAICGAEFTPHATKRKRQKTCSRPCANVVKAKGGKTDYSWIVWTRGHRGAPLTYWLRRPDHAKPLRRAKAADA